MKILSFEQWAQRQTSRNLMCPYFFSGPGLCEPQNYIGCWRCYMKYHSKKTLIEISNHEVFTTTWTAPTKQDIMADIETAKNHFYDR